MRSAGMLRCVRIPEMGRGGGGREKEMEETQEAGTPSGYGSLAGAGMRGDGRGDRRMGWIPPAWSPLSPRQGAINTPQGEERACHFPS